MIRDEHLVWGAHHYSEEVVHQGSRRNDHLRSYAEYLPDPEGHVVQWQLERERLLAFSQEDPSAVREGVFGHSRGCAFIRPDSCHGWGGAKQPIRRNVDFAVRWALGVGKTHYHKELVRIATWDLD
jgi:hypothetical protein